MADLCRILVLEDRPEDFELAERELNKVARKYDLKRVDSEDAFRSALEEFRPELILCDFSIPGFEGIKGLALAKEADPDVPVIMFTGTIGEDKAVECVRAGAVDYILKDHPARLLPAVEGALTLRRERQEKGQAQEDFRKIDRRYRELVESAPDAIIMADPHGRISLWNPAAEVVFGYSAEEATGEPLELIIPDRFQEAHHEAMGSRQEAIGWVKGSFQRTMTATGRRKNGEEFPAEISISSTGEGGRVGFTAVVRDVTERFLAQEALEQLSRQQELILGSAGEGILGLDPDGTVSFANPAALQLLAMEEDDAVGFKVNPLIYGPPDLTEGTEEADCPILASLENGSFFRGEMVFYRKDRTPFPTATSCTPIFEGEAIAGAVVVFEDITSRKSQEDALRLSEGRYRNLFEHATFGIYQSNPEGRFLAVNSALVEMLGYESADQLLSLDLKRDVYFDPKDRAALIKIFEETDRVVGVEAAWVKRDGAQLSVRLSGRVIRDEEHRVRAFEMMVEDLTERKALENQLRQSQKMEAVGQLTGGIAHDFNNVLAVILLNSEILRGAVEAGESVDMADIQAIHDAAQRAASITRKLLGFSRRAALLMEATDLGKVVRELSPMLRTLLPETIALDVKVAEGCDTVLVDTGSVEQMLMNLAANSRDAMPKGGRLDVSVSQVELDEDYAALHPGMEPGSFVCIEVSDTGTGMDEDTLQKIFEPFFTTKGVGAGTGLGMAMVYGLIKQQGGHVSVYSEVGMGTATRLYFPARGEAVVPRAQAEESPDSGQIAATILLVEDEDDLRAAGTKALKKGGFTVLVASDGTEALEIFREHRNEIDLVLSDLILPGLGGLELLKKLQDEYGPVRFILTSGYAEAEGGPIGKMDRSIPFLRKPWALKELYSLIGSTLAAAPPPLEATHG